MASQMSGFIAGSVPVLSDDDETKKQKEELVRIIFLNVNFIDFIGKLKDK